MKNQIKIQQIKWNTNILFCKMHEFCILWFETFAESLKRDLWNGQKSQIRPRRDGNRSETRISQLRELRVNCTARFRVRFSTPFKQDRPFIVRPLILFPPPSRSRDCRFLANHAAGVKVLTIHIFFSFLLI